MCIIKLHTESISSDFATMLLTVLDVQSIEQAAQILCINTEELLSSVETNNIDELILRLHIATQIPLRRLSRCQLIEPDYHRISQLTITCLPSYSYLSGGECLDLICKLTNNPNWESLSHALGSSLSTIKTYAEENTTPFHIVNYLLISDLATLSDFCFLPCIKDSQLESQTDSSMSTDEVINTALSLAEDGKLERAISALRLIVLDAVPNATLKLMIKVSVHDEHPSRFNTLKSLVNQFPK